MTLMVGVWVLQICLLCSNMDKGGIPFPTLAPRHLWQAEELSLCSPAKALKSGPVPHVSSTTELALHVGVAGELALSLACWATHTKMERPPPLPHPLPSTAGPSVMRVREQAMSFTSLNTWESRPYTSPRQ